MQDFFTDPKVEGAFLTVASRAVIDEYIQEEIKNHEAIVRYYKKCHNALTFTCRLPREILGAIFEEVAITHEAWQNYRRWGENYRKWREFDWIKNVSHVCSYWRAVALSNPNLWSNIRLMNTAWMPEMIQRSKTAPLTITLWGALILRDPTDSFMALKEVIRSDLSRIRSLTLGLVPVWVSPERHEFFLDNEKKRRLDMFSDLLPLLDQPAPMLESLEISLADAEVTKQLPSRFVAGLSRLKHLRLEGWCLDWKLSAFENIRSLVISCLSADKKPTVNELLDMLTRTPLLESLTIVDDVLGSTSLPQDIAQIRLEHLKHIDVSYSLSDCAFLFNHIVFSAQATTITIRLPESSAGNVYLNSHSALNDHLTLTSHSSLHNHSALAAIGTLARRLDAIVGGPIYELKVEKKIQCWKSNDARQPLVIDVHGLRSYELPPALKAAFWQSLRLDKLTHLEIFQKGGVATDQWSFLGALPELGSLRVWCNELVLMNMLEQGTAIKPDTAAFFVSLKVLTLVHWDLDLIHPSGVKGVGERIILCFNYRRKAGLPLQRLVMEDHAGNWDIKKFVNELRRDVEFVDVVSK